MTTTYESLYAWTIEVIEASHGLETPTGVRFARLAGRMLDRASPPDGSVSDNINCFYAAELTR